MAKQNSINNTSQDLTIDPGASGDSYIQFDINTTGEFRIGVDDTDSDKFKISQGSALGATDTFVMTAAGENTMPLQPAFLAHPSGILNNVTGDGTTYTVVFATEDFDQGGDFDGTSTFTAPITGKYKFFTLLSFTGIAAAHTNCPQEFNINAGAVRIIIEQMNFTVGQDVAGEYYTNGHIFVNLTAGDTVIVTARFLNGTKIVDIAVDSYFGGYLCCQDCNVRTAKYN